MRRGSLASVYIAAVLAGLVGCSPAGVPTHPVHGEIYYRGRPVAEAIVVFHPLGDNPATAIKPMAHTDAQGRFTLTTLTPGDGAPPGDYAITVELREAVLVGEEKTRTGQSLLAKRYSSPDKSPLRFRVMPGDNTVPRIEVTDSAK
ncbi:MAG: DUF4198 domain-containing protein [Planctomycetes bacterium]|nr:DUF4198 domain-containing protein [Planctomycetota bacterium]